METFTVNLEGGSPWGFSIQGGVDHRSPLRVGKVTAGGRASKAGLVAGDYILFVNGEDSKTLKHLQAQQIIKKSTNTVTLVCTKVRPGVTSPAVSGTSSFSFPGPASKRGVNGGVSTSLPREPVTKAQPISRPAPPQAPPTARSASTGTASECTPPSSSSPQSSADVTDGKFQEMDAGCVDKSHPLENGDSSGTGKSPPDVDFTCIDRSHPMQNGICYSQNVNDRHQTTGRNANLIPAQSPSYGKVDKRGQVHATPTAVQFNRLTKDALASAINHAAAERVRRESSGEREEPNNSINNGASVSSSSQMPVREEPVVQVEQTQQQPLEYQFDVPVDEAAVTETVSQELQSEPPLMYQIDADVSTEEKNSSSTDSLGAASGQHQHSSSDVFVEEGAPVVEETVDRVEQVQSQPLVYSFDTQAQTNGTVAKKVDTPPKQGRNGGTRKEEEAVAIVKKDPGWYKQMFQQFQNQVEEHFPGAKSNSNTENSTDDQSYVYDYRGLKVRKDSLSRTKPEAEEDKERAKKNQTPDEEPVYVYDYRGLRVRADSLSKVPDSTTQQTGKPPRPKSASAANNRSTTESEMKKDAVLSQSKQPTSYKTQKYDTGASRQYWKEKDEDHQKWDEKLRQSEQKQQSQEEHHQRSHSGSEDYAANLTHMHPLLRQAAEESGGTASGGSGNSSTALEQVAAEDQPKLFERIEASKLQEAVMNTSTVVQLQNAGLPSHLIPAVIDAQREAAAAEAEAAAAAKKEKPPPGPMAMALFDFTAQSSKELSFSKGDFLQLVHTVDDNWLGAVADGSEGNIPRNYVKVLTMEQYEEMLLPPAPSPTQLAKALYDFQGQSDREISFNKGDELYVERKVDANWYEGFHGDRKGIFPVAYVQVI